MNNTFTFFKFIGFSIAALFLRTRLDDAASIFWYLTRRPMLSCLMIYVFSSGTLFADKIKIEKIINLQNEIVDQEKIIPLSNALNAVLGWLETHKTILDGKYSIRTPKSKWKRLSAEITKDELFPVTYQEDFGDESNCWFAAPQKWGPSGRWRISFASSRNCVGSWRVGLGDKSSLLHNTFLDS